MEEELINYAGADILCETSQDWALYRQYSSLILMNNKIPTIQQFYYEKIEKCLNAGIRIEYLIYR